MHAAPPHPDYPGSNGPMGGGPSAPASSIGPPPSHHTTVTMTTNPNPGFTAATVINLNFGYFRTFPGVVKIVQLVSVHIS